MKTTLLRFFLPIGLLFSAASVQAQQSPSCATCACALPNPANTATNFFATAGAHDLNLPFFGATFTQQLAGTFNNRFHRAFLRLGSTYTISLCGNTYNTSMYVTNNATTPLIFACDEDGCGTANGPSIITFTPAADGLFRIYVYDGSCGNYFVNPVPNIGITITRNQANPAPPNDEPCGAIALPMGPACNFTNTTSQGATLSSLAGVGVAPVCITPSLLQNDVWFTTTVPASGLIGIQTEETGSLCAGAYNIYTASACNGTFTQLANSCALNGPTGATTDPASVFDAFAAGLSVGATVYIRYWERNGDENGTFSICAYEAQRPVNDEPCGAVLLPVTTSCVFTTFQNNNATALSTVTANPDPVTALCGGAATNDIWFAVTVTPAMVTDGFSVNMGAGMLNNMAMAWYRLTGPLCAGGTMTQIACSDNQSGANLMPRINSVPAGVVPVAGETIYIRVWNQTPWEGTFNICATVNQPPPNNLPCGAIPLTAQYGCIMGNYSNEGASNTPTGYQGGVPNPTCGPWNLTAGDVWFTVVMPPNGTIQLDTQAGTMNNSAMAIYTATGNCATNNLALTQATAPSCATNSSQQGPASINMPYLSYTNPALAGQTLYIRVWRTGASTSGTFGICARRTDAPPQNCFYTLNMFDTAGDGWNGSFVTVCVGAVCTNYTVNGANAAVNIGTNLGQTITVSYTPVGGFQNQNSFNLTQFGSQVFSSGTSPASGLQFAELVDCTPPPAPQSDCIGAAPLCGQELQVNQAPQNTGGVVDLNTTNRGCLIANERQGLWYTWTVEESGNLAFTIFPQPWPLLPGTPFTIFDWAVWGPYAGLTCPPVGLPYRCNWASVFQPKGMQFNNALPTSVGGAGPPMIRHMTVQAGEVYILYVDNWGMTGLNFSIEWGTTTNPAFQPIASIDCIILPADHMILEATPRARHVDVNWSTLSEQYAAYYDVQRSADGVNYATIGRVEALGVSQSMTNYSIRDEDPRAGLTYYRIKQVDVMGTISYSDVVEVVYRALAPQIEVFPNPADDRIQISFDRLEEGTVAWRILDASGRLVFGSTDAGDRGPDRMEIPIHRLEAGSYVIDLRDDKGNSLGNARFVKQ